jgi:hypothetical protein
MIRSFDWRDFPSLHRNRNDGIWLDTALALTRWMGLVPTGALLATLAPATGIYTYVAESDSTEDQQVVGQFIYPLGQENAKLTFLSPGEMIQKPAASTLLDFLAARAGDRGAHNLLAEVDAPSNTYDVLRKAGFAIYSRQRVWELKSSGTVKNSLWRQVVEKDEHHVHYLYHSLVPALVQRTEPPPWENMNGLIFEFNGDTMGYVHLSYGPKGILAQPFVHPDTDHAEELITTMHDAIPGIRSRPVYLAVRSHQAWLTPFMEELELKSGPHQAVMVKRMTVPLKELSPAIAKPAMDAQPKTSTYSLPGKED